MRQGLDRTAPRLRHGATARWASLVALALASAAPAHANSELRFALGGISEDYLGRFEANGPIPYNGVAIGLAGRAGRLDYGLTLAAPQDRPRDSVPAFDLGLRPGPSAWKIGLGKRIRHWSPSPHTSLILSRNSEAIPSLYVLKENATRSDSPLLRWIGPWRGEIFVGRTDDSFRDGDALMIGMELVVTPIPDLDVQLVRTVQLGGTGEPTSVRTVFDALIGQTNEGVASGANQMAGIGLSYRFDGIGLPTRLYTQVVGEDEAGGWPNCLIYLAGIEAQAAILGRTTISLETVDTRVDTTENGFCGPNTAYNNATYAYTNGGRVMGAAIDSEGAATNLRVRHDFETWSLHWGLGSYQINDAGDPDHRLSSERVSGTIASVGVGLDIAGGRLETTIVDQSFDLDAADIPAGLRVGVGFSRSF